ncbi:uncharacterized protein LOC130450374 [Diorhabda sublineata]|uniref:uncharacterized protein LOC130450374 n=1 Tax=Diorhabda sublineata TaxID=1163346 RepID=UPI0024E10E4A|nr:uncharacterized protein LOC130450374 [Diorhabda sublineata]
MKLDILKVVLEVLLQKFDIENDDFFQPNTFKLSKNLFNGIIIPDLFENVVETIKKRATKESKKEDCVKKILYKALLVIFLNTTQQERFLYLKKLLQHFYDELVQTLLKLEKNESIPTIEEFIELVTNLLPYVKLQVVKYISEQEKKEEDKLKASLMELYETVLHPNISREDCYEIIQNKLGDFDTVEFTDFEIKPVDEKKGFLGEYFILKIHVINQQQSEQHQFFYKHTPTKTDEIRTNMAQLSFRKEEKFYMTFVPQLKKMGFGKIVDFLPQCYLSRKDRFMVFEDASANNYSNLDIKIPFTYQQLSLLYKQLAKFHSCGLLFEEKLSKILGTKFRMGNYYKEMLTESFAIKNNRHIENFFDTCIKTNGYVIDKFKYILERTNVDEFKLKCSNSLLNYFNVVQTSNNRRNFLTHGDLWCNNFFFHNDQSSCLILDFQIIRYNLPSYDVNFLLATNTDLSTRRKYGDKLLKEYYSNLKSCLSEFEVNLRNIMTYDQFLADVDDVKATSLSVALMYLLTILLPKEKMARIFEDPELSQNFFTGDRSKIMDELWDDLKHKSRFEGVIHELCSVFNK